MKFNISIYTWVFVGLVAITSIGCGGKSPANEAVEQNHYAELTNSIDSITATIQARIGFAMMNLETGETFSYNGSGHMPMQSTYKFPIALTVLDMVDKGKLKLDQTVHIAKTEMDEETHSPIRDKYGFKDADVPLSEILYYTVAESDNIGCDVLFKLVGGTAVVNDFIHSKGIEDIRIVSTEVELHQNMEKQYDNWVAPMEMVRLLHKFYKGEIVSAASTDTLRNIMERTPGGAGRIKGMLPAGTVVAHKTGTGKPDDMVCNTVNDIGIITMPDGKHMAMAIYLSDAKVDIPECENVMAGMARAAYDHTINTVHD